MTDESNLPYRACRLQGKWYVVKDKEERVISCDCRHDAEWFARELNGDANYMRIAGPFFLRSPERKRISDDENQ